MQKPDSSDTVCQVPNGSPLSTSGVHLHANHLALVGDGDVRSGDVKKVGIVDETHLLAKLFVQRQQIFVGGVRRAVVTACAKTRKYVSGQSMARCSPSNRINRAVVLCLLEKVSPTPRGRTSSGMRILQSGSTGFAQPTTKRIGNTRRAEWLKSLILCGKLLQFRRTDT